MELRNRAEVEAKLRKRALKLNNKHRRELMALLGSPPDPSRVPPAFWAKVQQETDEQTAALLTLLFLMATQQMFRGSGVSREERQRMQPALNNAAMVHGRSRAFRLGQGAARAARQRMVDGLARVAEQHNQAVASALQQGVQPPAAPARASVEDELASTFSPERIPQVIRDETTAARTEGGETSARIAGLQHPDDLWINHPERSRTGPCPTCAPLHRKPRTVWAQVFPSGPPAPHRGCVCTIEYSHERRDISPRRIRAEGQGPGALR